jgi:Periplasmic copper-binding protein (NosD)
MNSALVLAVRSAVVAIAISIVLVPPPAHAAHVQCGDVITEDTRLDSDLLDCPGDGVVIGASNVSLDLGGHMIDGIGTSFTHHAYGVVADIERLIELGWGGPLPSALSGVTVTNGSIRQFAAGVALEVVDDSTIRRLDLSDSLLGGISINWSDGVRIEGNWLSGTGILVSSSNGPVIRRNHLTGGSIGMTEASDALAVENSISRATTGISLSQGSDNAIVRNTVAHSLFGIQANEYRTRVERNLVYVNERDGIRVDCCGDVVVGNRAIANGDDGIEIGFGSDEFAANLVSRNTANYNGDLGIEAAAGVMDGGHNRAHRNGNALQCVNVACRPSGRAGRR